MKKAMVKVLLTMWYKEYEIFSLRHLVSIAFCCILCSFPVSGNKHVFLTLQEFFYFLQKINSVVSTAQVQLAV